MADSPDDALEQAIEELFYPHEMVPFVNWDEFSGAKPAVVLTGVVTGLSFVTGLSNLSQTEILLEGPLAPVMPAADLFARFAGVIAAFLLGLVTFGLQRRKRLALRVALLVLPLLALLPLTTLQTTDIPLLLVLCVTYPLLVWNRQRFDRPVELSPLQVASLFSIVGVVVYGTMGAYGLREQFVDVNGWGDAIYYVIVTIATVGYGDITPLTPVAKWFSLSIIVFGTGAFTVAVGALLGPAIESRMAAAFGNMKAEELSLLEDHVVVLGYGEVTESLLQSLDGETDLVVVTSDSDVASSLDSEGINVLTGDPTDEAVLEDAGLDIARGAVVGSDDDATDVLSVIAAKNVAPDVRVVAGANSQKHVEKLISVGANEVINPHQIGGRLLGASILDEEAELALTDVFEEDDTA
ncbi:potassium channel protein [Halobacteriales archaeon QS_4_66_20]|nr:MAG: potassium channel protein [Halobacteriales archaeon QS_4_66_20]